MRLDNVAGGTSGPTELTWTTATGGLISFGDQTYLVKEGAGAVYQATISRQGGLASGASVRLVSSDDLAVGGDDYTPVDVTVIFNPGEATKTVNIPILNDAESEGDEGFLLTLLDASGGVLGEFTEAYVAITDDEDDPANDNFISRLALGANGTQLGTTTGAGSEVGEPDHGFFSVWYGWTSPAGAARVATFGLNGSSGMFGPTVTVYTGTTLGGLTQVAQGFDGVSFLTTPNTAYIIAITERGGDDGFGFIEYSPSDFELTFGSAAGGSIISFTTTPLSVAETADTLVVNLTRSGSTTGTTTVDYSLTGDFAFADEDYTDVVGTVTFAAGEATQTITIDILNDAFSEGDETFTVDLTNPTGAVLAGSDPLLATVTILDDDDDILPPTNDNFANAVVLTGSNPIVTGFTEGATVEASEPTVGGELPEQSVWYKWTAPGNGAARLSLNSATHSTSAYTGTTLATLSEVTFLASGSFAVTSGTTYFVPVNAESGSQFELTINFTAAGLFSFDEATLSVNEASGPAVVTIRRTNGTTGAASVRFRAVAQTATVGSDFTAVDTVVNFASGVASQTVNVAIANDALTEGGESVRVILSDPTGGAITAYGPDEVVLLVIQDDESIVGNDNFADALAISGPFGTTFGVNSGATSQPGEPDHAGDGNGNSIWFRWTAPTGGIVTFETAGSSISTALAAYSGASVNALTALDSDSDFGDGSSISFSAVAGAAYRIAVDSVSAGGQGDVTLSWNLVAPGEFTFNPPGYSVSETAGTVVLTVARGGGIDGAVSVNYATSSGTALAGQDYTTTSGTLNFANGDTSKTITVTVLDDTAVEAGEAFNVTLSGATNGATIGTATAVVGLSSEDTASEFNFSPTSYSVGEAATSVMLTVSRTGGGVGAASVNYATSNGTAVAGQDYTATSGTLNFAIGETSKPITVPVTNDTAFELGESFSVTLSVPSVGATIGAATALVALTSNDPFAPNAVTFAALVNPGGVHAESGLLTMIESATGAFSGKLTLGGKVLRFKGAFDPFGNAIVTLPRSGASPVSASIQIGAGGKAITGHVYDGTFDSTFAGEASFYDGRTRLYAQPGPFTLALRPTSAAAGIPQGIGTATLTVKSNGTFTLKGGQLADSTAFSATGFIAESGQVQFYSLLYKGQGSLAGVVSFRNQAQTDADGSIKWFKPANLPNQKFFGLSGVNADLDLVASFYAVPGANTRIDAAFDANSGATEIALVGGNLAAPLAFTGPLATTNKFSATTPVPLTLAGASKTGKFTGNFTPTGGSKTAFKGVFLQKSNNALGQFFGPTLSGSVTVQPD